MLDDSVMKSFFSYLESTYCPYGPMECREIRNRYAIKNAPGTPVIALVADSSRDLEEEEDVIVKGDSSPEILHPVRIGPHVCFS